jgi:hypothetical protein
MLREETVEPATLGLLKEIVALPELKQFRLVGGTAIALLFGHRKSIDLDLFTDQSLEKDILVSTLENTFGKVDALDAKLLQIYSMTELFQFYHDRYNYDGTFAVIRSMIYFENAEDDVDPTSLDGMTWSKVKKTILKAFDDYYKEKSKN